MCTRQSVVLYWHRIIRKYDFAKELDYQLKIDTLKHCSVNSTISIVTKVPQVIMRYINVKKTGALSISQVLYYPRKGQITNFASLPKK